MVVTREPSFSNIEFIDLPSPNSYPETILTLPATVAKLWGAIGKADIVQSFDRMVGAKLASASKYGQGISPAGSQHDAPRNAPFAVAAFIEDVAHPKFEFSSWLWGVQLSILVFVFCSGFGWWQSPPVRAENFDAKPQNLLHVPLLLLK